MVGKTQQMLIGADTPYGRILSVDNESQAREKIACALEDSGFSVFQANNGQEALMIFRTEKPDVVLTDLNMPIMGGLELLEILKKESPETPVIVVSASDEINQVIEALRMGAWDYIAKPVTNTTVLEHSVCRALERGRLTTELNNYRLKLEEKNSQLKKSLHQLEEDQKAGKSVQQLFLPKNFYKFKNYFISYKIIPSLYLSGDFVDYFEINNEKMGFYIADVSGHGASSAFITILLKNLVERLLVDYQEDRNQIILHPEKVLKHLSDNVLNSKLGKYLTMVYCVLDVEKNYLTYSIGGHYPNLMLWDGVSTSFLPGHGFAVGIFKDAVFESYQRRLPENFVLAMFSDGVFEVMKGKSSVENEKKLLGLINPSQKNAAEVLGSLGIRKNKNYPDDIALFLMKREERCKPNNK